MANVFLNGESRDVETAIMLEQAIVHDIGKAVAYTDGDRIFINTDDRLYDILPAYDHNMLKWLLWHERYHKELRHHNRFFRYLSELRDEETYDEFRVTKEEVNIIMDILVHDSLAKLFPELIETAVNNLAQMRNRNSLEYTFKTFTLEEMLEEYSKHKHGEDEEKTEEGEGDTEGEDTTEEDKDKGDSKKSAKGKDGEGESEKKSHSEGGSDKPKEKDRPEDGEPEEKDASAPTPEPPSEHDKTDWTKLEDIDSKEFITAEESDRYIEEINRLKRMKAKLGKLTETLNGLVTSQRHRTYTKPNPIKVGGGVVLKGSKPGRVALYLCFDASGSMGCEMETFKEIISKSIPQAMTTPTEWFSGHNPSREHKNPAGRNSDYYKGQFKDFMNVYASSGYDDDGDRTIELCYLAEQKGYTPIGVTDGGGQISWSKDMIKKLQRTILVGQSERWLEKVKEINPRIQTLHV